MEIFGEWWTGVILWSATLVSILTCLPEYKKSKKEFFYKNLNLIRLLIYFCTIVYSIGIGIVFTIIVIVSIFLLISIYVHLENSKY